MKYLLKKDGLYYRPGSCGYTQFAFRAGIFSEEYAKNHEKKCSGEVKAIPVTELNTYELEDIKEVLVTSKDMIEAYKEAEASS